MIRGGAMRAMRARQQPLTLHYRGMKLSPRELEKLVRTPCPCPALFTGLACLHMSRCWSLSAGGARLSSSTPSQAGVVRSQSLHGAGVLAQKRLARGLRLNEPEAVALLATQMLEMIRDGKPVHELMLVGKELLGVRQVMPGVPAALHDLQVEGTFPDGTKLLTVHSPICRLDGDMSLALYGSFLPIPDLADFGPVGEEEVAGAVTCAEEGVEINAGRVLVEVEVANTGDRPIQVGSHYHFLETNKALEFDRELAFGRRLNVAAGNSVRFEPGEKRTITLVDIAGERVVRGGNNLTNGPATPDRLDEVMKRVEDGGFKHKKQATVTAGKPLILDRANYVEIFGPTTGDLVQLGDTSLMLQVEDDLTVYGDECKFGGGKTLREGMGQATDVSAADALDYVITNALIVDHSGIIKADIGIKDGYITGIGKAGNPDVMAGVTRASHPAMEMRPAFLNSFLFSGGFLTGRCFGMLTAGMITGVTTEAIGGEKLIITAGGMDSHVHFICPQLADEAIASGLTTMLGGGTGPASGTTATTCTPSPSQVKMMLQATDDLPLNFAFSGKGNTAADGGLMDVLEAGAIGFKLHEDWGTTPAVIDNALCFADDNDCSITIHTDTLNESGFVDSSIAAMKGRTIHTCKHSDSDTNNTLPVANS